MAKFLIRCPYCDTVNTASTSLFAKKVISCVKCNNEISVKDNRLVTRVCPKCKDTISYDQAKGVITKCPSCGEKFDAFHFDDKKNIKRVVVNCPKCNCAAEVEVNENEENQIATCPICGAPIDVKKEIAKAKLVNTNGVSVIMYEGDNSTFVWKHPIEDFNMGTQLVVHESQEAVFFMNGQALDLFGPGRYTLETENIPVLKNLYKMPTGEQTPFHCEVYFINKVTQMAIKWGTDSRVRFIDPATGIPLDIGASGELNLQVADSRKLLVKLVGANGGLKDKNILSSVSDTTGSVHRSLQSYFRAPLMTEIKSYLASTIKAQKIDIMEIDEQMGILSDALRERIAPKFEEYGLTIPNFYITYISLPEDDENFQKLRKMRSSAYIDVREEEVKADIAGAAQKRKVLEAQTEAQLEAIKAQGEAEAARAKGLADAEVMRAKGYTEKDVLSADVQKAYAEGLGKMGSNAGSGSGGSGGGNMFSDIMTASIGMKMAGSMMNNMDFGTGFGKTDDGAAKVTLPTSDVNTWVCDCGEIGNTKKFCMSCGKQKPENWDCPCGHKGNKGKFCENCGQPKASSWDCPVCGSKGNTIKFCPECGAKRPE